MGARAILLRHCTNTVSLLDVAEYQALRDFNFHVNNEEVIFILVIAEFVGIRTDDG